MTTAFLPRPTAVSQPPAHADVVIIGSGAGGGAVAYGLRHLGGRVVVLERGGYLAHEPENWDATAVFVDQRYKAHEQWVDEQGRPFRPGVQYFVGGNTKVYGAALPRFRVDDFAETQHQDGISPAWPFGYDELEPYYAQAEQLYAVHHAGSADATDPPRSTPPPFPALAHEPTVAAIADRLRAAGYSPAYLPIGIDLRPDGRCIRCATCDGFPCLLDAKSDAETTCLRPAQAAGVTIVTDALVTRVCTTSDGTAVTGVDFEHNGQRKHISAAVVVVAAGAVNTAALLLRSVSAAHPDGLANGSGAVGRHYMVHNNTVMTAVGLHPSHVRFQKTLYVNDFYAKGTKRHPYPLGHVQLIGKVQAPMLRAQAPFVPDTVLRAMARRSSDWWLFTEDLPDPNNRVQLTNAGQIRVCWQPNNVAAHKELVRQARTMARRAGYPVALTKRMGVAVNSHQAGTARAGTNPATAVVDPQLRSHQVRNLYLGDSSVFPSLPAINPALTIVALGLRLATTIAEDVATVDKRLEPREARH